VKGRLGDIASVFGSVATLMSCLGLYGVIAYAVARRTSKIGVRISPGATWARICRMVSAESATLVLTGIIIGTALAAVVTRVLSSLWFGIGVNDPVTFTIAALLVVAVASVATALPALRASRIDPVAAMRTQ
jgi:ABC-type antimicrobial peptide transport system permease subunit